MPTSVALLRGINVGGNRKIRMADLVSIFEEGGFTDVKTYVQSGNVVFTHPRRAQPALTTDIERRIHAATDLPVPVILRTAAQMGAVVEGNPFGGADTDIDPTKLVVAFFAEPPDRERIMALDKYRSGEEELVLSGRELYLSLPHGQGRSKLAQATGTVRPGATARNWRTVLTLVEMSGRS